MKRFYVFHETCSKILPSARVRRVGIAPFINEKNRCPVMIILDTFVNISLTPLIIFTGVFGANL